jgi:hypothetical protein
VEFDLKYLSLEPDRHGNLRLYVRRYGRRIRLRVTRDDPAFLDAYQKALTMLAELPNAAEPPSDTAGKKIAVRGSLGWLASLYFGSDEFKNLKSGPTRRAVIEDCLRETVRELYRSDGRLPALPRHASEDQTATRSQEGITWRSE